MCVPCRSGAWDPVTGEERLCHWTRGFVMEPLFCPHRYCPAVAGHSVPLLFQFFSLSLALQFRSFLPMLFKFTDSFLGCQGHPLAPSSRAPRRPHCFPSIGRSCAWPGPGPAPALPCPEEWAFLLFPSRSHMWASPCLGSLGRGTGFVVCSWWLKVLSGEGKGPRWHLVLSRGGCSSFQPTPEGQTFLFFFFLLTKVHIFNTWMPLVFI